MATRKQTKKTRISLSERRNLLTTEGKEKGWVYRWVNDIDGKISKFTSWGYETVSDKQVSIGDLGVDNPSTIGGTISKNVGQGMVAYLMRTRKEDYDEDQLAKAGEVDMKEESLNEHIRELSGRYGGIEIKR